MFEDLARTDGVVANFGIAHLASDKSDVFARGADGKGGVDFHGGTEKFEMGEGERIALDAGAQTDAVHDDENDRAVIVKISHKRIIAQKAPVFSTEAF